MLHRMKRFQRFVGLTDASGIPVQSMHDGVNKTGEIDKKNQKNIYRYDNINRLKETDEYDAAGTLRTTDTIEYRDDQQQVPQLGADRNRHSQRFYRTINEVPTIILIGSVTEKLVRNAPCSVLVVKLPKGVQTPVHADVEMATGPA